MGQPVEPKEEEVIINIINSSEKDPLKVCTFLSNVMNSIGKPLAFVANLCSFSTLVILDTGAGANCINPRMMEENNLKPLDVYRFPKPLVIQVGNSQTTRIEKAVLLEMSTKKKNGLFWFLVVNNLPMNALIGGPTAVQEYIHYDKKGEIYWAEERLPSREYHTNTINFIQETNENKENENKENGNEENKNEENENEENGKEKETTQEEKTETPEKRKSTPPQEAIVAERVVLQPRSMSAVKIKIKNDDNLFSEEAFFAPQAENNLNIFILPGLINFDEDSKEAVILVQNLTERKRALVKNKELGSCYFISEEDAEQTELFEFGNKSLTDIKATTEARKAREKEEEQKQPKEQTAKERKRARRKVRRNLRKVQVNVSKVYLNTLIEMEIKNQKRNNTFDKSINEENETVSPVFFSDILGEPQSYLDGFLDREKMEIQKSKGNIDGSFAEPSAHAHVLTMNQKEKQENQAPIDERKRKVYELFKLNESDLNDKQVHQLINVLLEYEDVWDVDKRPKTIVHTTQTECPIETTGEPIRSKPHRTGPVERHIIKKHVQKMAERKVIRRSTSPWASPVILADKKNGKIRFCVDYRKLNNVTIKNAYPLPRMDNILDILGKSSFFSTIDLTDAFWSIKVKDEDIHKTAFISSEGLWEFISMPFGLTNAPATQQQFIETVLNGLIWECCFAYIDDILCFSNTFENHLEHIAKILERLRKYQLAIQPPKCSFCKPTFEILGLVASKNGVKPAEAKVKSILEYPYPSTLKEAQSFLGMVSWLRKFIHGCSQRTKHLRDCMKDGAEKFQLTVKAKEEIDQLKKIITQYPCLAHPDLEKQFYIHVDASAVGVGAILTQEDDKGKHRVIEYASTPITRKDWTNTTREAYGVLWALVHFKYYILGRDPIVYCDCECLSKVLKSAKEPSTTALRNWVARLLHFNPKVLHKPGKAMAIPDALSRAHTIEYRPEDDDPARKLLGSIFKVATTLTGNQEECLDEQRKLLEAFDFSKGQEDIFDDIGEIRLLILPTLVEQSDSDTRGTEKELLVENKLARAQRDDPYWCELITYLVDGLLPRYRNRVAYIKSIANQFMVDEKGILRKLLTVKKEGEFDGYPAVLPGALLKETLEQLHDNPLSGHRKYEKLLETVRKRYYFPNMPAIVKRYCDLCTACQCSTIRKKRKAPLKPYYASFPGIYVHIDCTPGPNKKKPTARGYTQILTIVEAFTRHVRLYPITKPCAKETARVLLSYICVHSMPLKIIVDNGSEFANELMTELSLLLGLKKVHVTPYNSKANGKVEVTHKTTQTILRAYMDKFRRDWDLLLPLVEFAMNTSVNKSTGHTPFYLFYGRHPILPLDAYHDSVEKPTVTVNEYVKSLQDQRKKVFEWVNNKMRKEMENRKEKYDKKNESAMRPLKVGDTVRERNHQRKGKCGQKFNTIFQRKFYVVDECIGDSSYEIRNMADPEDTKVVNIEKIEKFPTKFEIDIHAHNKTISNTEVVHYTDDDDDNDDDGSGSEDESDSDDEMESDDEEDNDSDEEEFEVYKVLKDKKVDGEQHFQVQWKGYTQKHATWLPEKKLNCQELIDAYLENKAEKARIRKQKEIDRKRKRDENQTTQPRRSKRNRS